MKTAKPKPPTGESTIEISGIMYRVYFEAMYEDVTNRAANYTPAVMVIADDVEAALEKVKAIYPRERINSIHCDRPFTTGPVKPEKIIL